MRIFAVAIVIAATAVINAAPLRVASTTSNVSADGLWREAPAAAVSLSATDVRALRPPAALSESPLERLFMLDTTALRQRLDKVAFQPLLAASDWSDGALVTLPLPDGTYMPFRVKETRVMPAELAAQFPDIRTYSGVSTTDPAIRASIERTGDGWSAMILTHDGPIFVSRLVDDDPTVFTSVAASTMRETTPFVCSAEVGPKRRFRLFAATRPPVRTFGGTTRTYRLAVTAAGEYTAHFRQSGDTDDQAKTRALGEINRLVARLNEVFSRDVGVQFTLVAKQLDIIYTDPATDPFTDITDANKLLEENQTNMDKNTVIGAANYDIGHVVHTDDGGRATTPSVCRNGRKARGETGAPRPTDDSFFIGYVAHEIGHQFSANHTFNGSVRPCSGSRNEDTAYEPGSGSTIMGYAPLCGSQKVAEISDDYFHAASLHEISAYVEKAAGGGACGTATANGNTAPTVRLDGAATVVVPKQTPFELRVAGTDGNGDPLWFTFEQFTRGGSSPPDNDSKNDSRPTFRSRRVNGPRRTLPSIENLAAGTPVSKSFEALPTRSQDITFRMVARDLRGGYAMVDQLVRVAAGAGPFAITEPAVATKWKVGTTQTVKWSVANTDKTPLSCANVRIAVSTDGGATFTSAVASTANDGEASVTAPAATSNAVVRIDCLVQPFAAVSRLFAVVP